MDELDNQDVENARGTYCLAMDPVVGFCCTLPAFHDGDHVASCGPGEDPGAKWPQTPQDTYAQRTRQA